MRETDGSGASVMTVPGSNHRSRDAIRYPGPALRGHAWGLSPTQVKAGVIPSFRLIAHSCADLGKRQSGLFEEMECPGRGRYDQRSDLHEKVARLRPESSMQLMIREFDNVSMS